MKTISRQQAVSFSAPWRGGLVFGLLQILPWLAPFAPSATAALYTFQGTAATEDTQLVSVYPDDNFGGNVNLDVGRQNVLGIDTRRSLIRFPTISSTLNGLTATSVSLELGLQLTPVGTFTNATINVYAVAATNANWSEGSGLGTNAGNGTPDNGFATWSQKIEGSTSWAGSPGLGTSGTDYVATPVGSFTVSSTDSLSTIYTVNFSNLAFLQNWIGNPTQNGGFLLQSSVLEAGEDMIRFSSSEGSTPPTLKVEASLGSSGTILIDLGKTGQTTTTYNGEIWNNVAAAAATTFSNGASLVTNLLTTDNVATGIDLSVVSTGSGVTPGSLGIGNSDTTTTDGTAIGYPLSATRDQLYKISTTPGDIAILRLSDLATDGTTYDLTMYGTINDGGNRISRWIVNGVPMTLSLEDNNTNSVSFLGILPDAFGRIDIGYEQAGTTSAVWSVLEINIHAVVPEPSTLILAAFGSVAIFRRVRQRR